MRDRHTAKHSPQLTNDPSVCAFTLHLLSCVLHSLSQTLTHGAAEHVTRTLQDVSHRTGGFMSITLTVYTHTHTSWATMPNTSVPVSARFQLLNSSSAQSSLISSIRAQQACLTMLAPPAAFQPVLSSSECRGRKRNLLVRWWKLQSSTSVFADSMQLYTRGVEFSIDCIVHID